LKVDLRGPKTLREILRFSYQAYASQFRPLFLIALATVPLQMLDAVVTDRVESKDVEQALMIPIQAANAVVLLIVTGALIHGANLIASGTPVEAGEAIDAAFARIGQIVTTQLLFAVLAVASIVAFPYTAYRYLKDIPANEPRRVWTYPGAIIGAFLYFWLRWTFSLQAVMLEKRQNWSALDASADAVRGSWWRTLLYVLTIVLVAIVPATLVASGAIYLPVLASAIIIAGVTALVIPFVILGQTFLYFDLKARRQTDASTN
jgi:hypothetical protein